MAKRTINDPQDTTQKAEDWATQTSPKIRGELRYSWRAIGFCSIRGTRVSHESGKKDGIAITTNGTYT
jgi:hypothetical protein